MAKVKPVEKEEKKTKEVKEVEKTAKELEHEKNLARLNPPFDPDVPERNQRHLRT